MARKILLADDSVTAQNMGKKILSDAGYEVTTVSNGSAALKRVQENPPDLIVLDVYMPGYSGLEVCRRLKESDATAHIPVLLTVGKLEPFKPDEARKARAEAFVVKPFEASELLSMVQRLETDPPKVKAEEPKSSRKRKGLAEVFASAALVEAPDPNAEIDEAGWRDRLSIPHKSHQEPDEAPEVATWGSGSFRDLTPVEIDSPRRESPFTAEPFVASSIPPTPQDATAEEIAALQAAAAALMGGGDAALPVAKAAPAEAAPVPAKDVLPPAPEISSTPSEAQAVSAKEAVASATTPVAEPVAAPAETKAVPLVEEAGVIDQSEEPFFAGGSEPKAQASSPSAKEEVAETKLEPMPAAEKEKAPEEGKKEAEVISATPAAVAPAANNEVVPEQEKKTEKAVASAPATPTAVAQEKEGPPEAEKRNAEEVAAAPVAPVTPTPVAVEKEETPKAEKKKAKEETASAPAPAPVAKEDEAPRKDKKKATKKEERRKEAEPEPVPVAAASTFAVSHCWVAHPLPLEAIEVSLALDREMAQFRAAAAAVEGATHAATMVAGSAVAVAEPEPDPRPAPPEASKLPVQESAIPVVAEAALAAAVGAGAETRSETSAAPAAASEKPIAEADMDRRSAAEMKAAWANWREIRESIVGSNMSQQVVDLASSVAGKSEASPDDDSEKPAGDPTAIANIVDSVLAELKPKIVEEIAKKLKKT